MFWATGRRAERRFCRRPESCVGVVLGGSTRRRDDLAVSESDPRVLVERFYGLLWNEWNDDAVDAVLTPAFVFRGSLGTETVGRDGWRSYRDAVRCASPDFHNEIIEMVCQGEMAAAKLVCTGHHEGVLLGTQPTGRAFRYDVAAFFRCRDGALAQAWVLGDLDALRNQLTL